ncbi:hypothetical protein TD95_003888 [Thielaviopsis punctulata]|uniref:Uncharacterized protein n=1 Tax=Thielaviopsis punctulata TaxID=72032 RepID=A0A0F4ZIQ5_9PEZI|nr:hypothetical protein TD95_003888 [Thielaviopsis punctulata]
MVRTSKSIHEYQATGSSSRHVAFAAPKRDVDHNSCCRQTIDLLLKKDDELWEMKEMIKQTDHTLKKQDQNLKQREETVMQNLQKIKEEEESLLQKEAELRQKEDYLAQREAFINQKETDIEKQEELVESLRGDIDHERYRVQGRVEEIKELVAELDCKDAALERMTESAATHDAQIEYLNNTITRDRMIIDATKHRYNTLKDENRQLVRLIAQLRADLEEADRAKEMALEREAEALRKLRKEQKEVERCQVMMQQGYLQQYWGPRRLGSETASAPLSGRHINVSPKGLDAHFRALSPTQVAYIDRTGSGCETISHAYEPGNGRLTIAFISFGRAPRILRLFSTATVVEWDSPQFDSLVRQIAGGKRSVYDGARAVIVCNVFKVQTSCGFGVPMVRPELYAGEKEEDNQDERSVFMDRSTLDSWIAKKVASNQALQYQADNNVYSLDGLPGLKTARRAVGENIRLKTFCTRVSGALSQTPGMIVGFLLGVLFSFVYMFLFPIAR